MTVTEYPMPRTDPFHPPPEYTRLRADGPVVRARLRANGNETWLITRYEEAKAVLADTRFSSDSRRPGFPVPRPQSALMGMDPPEHTRYRQMLNAEFGSRRIAELRPAVQGFTERLLDEIAARPDPVDLVSALAMPLPALVICRLLGLPESDHLFLQSRTTAALGIAGTPDQMRSALSELRAYIAGIAAEKLERPGDDLIGRLVVGPVRSGDCPPTAVAEIASVLLSAGLVTTVNMIGIGILTLLRHPDQLAALRARPDTVPAAVNELLRHLSVTATVSRVATEDVEIGGTLIRAGDGVMVLLSSANRDERVFADPDAFDIARQERGHLAFGKGPHVCIGAALARLELHVVMAAVLQRFPALRLAADVSDIPFRLQETIYGVNELPVHLR
ncbi:cytochrome P450 [Nocardia nova]|uniref:cytochrome P450 n=1 Tax=Nocardia nova TaxID=37330 RepID=UPI00379FC738